MSESVSLRKVLGGFSLLSMLTLSMAVLLYSSNSRVFSTFFGDNNPFVILISLSILGLILSEKLEILGFLVYRKDARRLRYRYFALAVLLAMIIIQVDIFVRFPYDLNIIFPYSVLYYPIFGYVVEVLFHMTPVFFLLYVVRRFFSTNKITISAIIILVSLLEPFFQLSLGFSSSVPAWTLYYVGVHIFLINIIQLILFWRFDFLTMYSFRMLYYLCWHIIWGYLRLNILF